MCLRHVQLVKVFQRIFKTSSVWSNIFFFDADLSSSSVGLTLKKLDYTKLTEPKNIKCVILILKIMLNICPEKKKKALLLVEWLLGWRLLLNSFVPLCRSHQRPDIYKKKDQRKWALPLRSNKVYVVLVGMFYSYKNVQEGNSWKCRCFWSHIICCNGIKKKVSRE